MLKRFGRRHAMLFLERDHKADNHPGKGRVNARLQHRRPQHRANQNIDPGTPHAAQIQGHQHRNRRRRHAQREHGQVVGIKQRDNHDSPEVINNRQRHQENLQRRRDPAT